MLKTVDTTRLPAFGFLSRLAIDHSYEFSGRGFMFTSPWVNTRDTQRHSATILLSLSGGHFVIESGDRAMQCTAALVGPCVRRSLYADDIGLVSMNVTPNHPSFVALKRASADGIQPLSRQAFAPLHDSLKQAYHGHLSLAAAEQLQNRCVSLALVQLPVASRVVRGREQQLDVLGLLSTRQDISLTEAANLLNLSYDRASDVIASALGLPLKSYYYWRKMATVWDSLVSPTTTLTEAAQIGGFSDSAHLSRTWKTKLGTSPSYIRNAELVRVVRA